MTQQNPILIKSISELNDYCIKNNKSIKVKNGLIVGFYSTDPKVIPNPYGKYDKPFEVRL